jgi:hypothetical protein
MEWNPMQGMLALSLPYLRIQAKQVWTGSVRCMDCPLALLQGACQGVHLQVIDTPGLYAAAGDSVANTRVLKQIRRCVCIRVHACTCACVCSCACACLIELDILLRPGWRWEQECAVLRRFVCKLSVPTAELGDFLEARVATGMAVCCYV